MNLLAALEISLLFVCIWGLIAVLLTSQFSAIIILLCVVALVISYRIRRRGWRPTPMTTNITAILVFLIAGGYFFSTLNLLSATVYLFLFLQVTKFATRRSLQEIRWCYLISLFHVVGASVITTALTFGVMLVIYIFLVLTSLRLYVMARELAATGETLELESTDKVLAKDTGALTAPRRAQPVAPGSLLRSSLLLTLGVLLTSSVLFGMIPRLQTQNLFQTYGPPPEDPAVSAFAENVEFGSFTQIQYDDGVALFVEPTGKERPENIRMRGVALDTFDGKAWKRTNYINHGGNTYEFRPVFTTRLYPATYRFNVIQPPGITNFLFGDSFPIELNIPRQFVMLVDAQAQSAHLSEMPPKEFQYEVVSMHEELSLRRDPAKSDEMHRPLSDLYQTRSENEPPSTSSEIISAERLAELARRFALEYPGSGAEESIQTQNTEREEGPDGQQGPHYDSSATSEGFSLYPDYLIESFSSRRGRQARPRTPKERLQYYLWKCTRLPVSLSSGRVSDLARTWTENADTTFAMAMAVETRLRNDYNYSLTPRAKGNFIDDFLFEVREGHCEYFATSMAVLLRNIGIPARVVNGYYSTEWNAISGNFTVRNRDAHSWVEAWLGDEYGWMTFDPTPPGGVARRGDRSALLDSFSRVMDAVRVRWYRYVVDYSIADQVSAFRKVMQWRQALMAMINRSNIAGLDSDTSAKIEIGDFSREIDWRPVILALAVIMMLLGWQAVRWVRRERNRKSEVKYYDDLLRLLGRHGLYMEHGQTPREFASVVTDSNMEWKGFKRATEAYYRTRYQGLKPDAEDLGIISDLTKLLKRRK